MQELILEVSNDNIADDLISEAKFAIIYLRELMLIADKEEHAQIVALMGEYL